MFHIVSYLNRSEPQVLRAGFLIASGGGIQHYGYQRVETTGDQFGQTDHQSTLWPNKWLQVFFVNVAFDMYNLARDFIFLRVCNFVGVGL